jgi:Zinc finger, C2H2 type
LDELLTEAQRLGIWRFKQVLKALKPDAERGRSLKLVSTRPKPLTCPVESCVAKFAEQKEVNRHVRKSHPNTTAGQAAPLAAVPLAAGGDEERRHARGVISTQGGRTGQDNGGVTLYGCTVAGCSRSYKSPGWLARHIKSNHSGLAVPHCPIILPPAVVAGVGLPNGEMTSVINMVGRTPNVTGPQIPVSSSGDGGAGWTGSLRSVIHSPVAEIVTLAR